MRQSQLRHLLTPQRKPLNINLLTAKIHYVFMEQTVLKIYIQAQREQSQEVSESCFHTDVSH